MADREETIAQLQHANTIMMEAQQDASVASGRLEESSSQVRSMMDDVGSLRHVNMDGAADILENAGNILARVASQLTEIADIFGDAMEKAQRAATVTVIQTEGAGNNLPTEAISQAALAQLSWANASGQCISAAATAQEAGNRTPWGALGMKLEELAATMNQADDEHNDAVASIVEMRNSIQAYINLV